MEKYLKFVTKKPAVQNIGNLRRARGATDGTDGDRWLWGAPTLSGAKWLARRVPGWGRVRPASRQKARQPRAPPRPRPWPYPRRRTRRVRGKGRAGIDKKTHFG